MTCLIIVHMYNGKYIAVYTLNIRKEGLFMYASYSYGPDLTGFYVFLFIVGIVGFCLHLLACSELANSAEAKGHDRGRYWHFCFWLGIPGYIVAAGLADLTLQHQLRNLTSKMEEQNNVSTAQVKKEQEKDVASFLPNL